ncbi:MULTISPECIES: hypothetical protein [Bacillus]|uniref:hypothetical protein n=1 Tax=Bacillus TaxID=1386 RepID=UPI0002E920E4|nr:MULTISPECIES: hypothetical protein [Bacillus]
MKKFFKFGCLGFIALIVIFIIIAVAGGGDSDKVSTGSDNNKNEEKETKTVDDGSKKVDASSQNMDAVGLKIGLGEIKITDDKILVGINIENTNSKAVSFYPDQGSAVVGNMQLDANLFLTDGDIGGDVQSGVKQEGVIEFLAPKGKNIDVKSVKEIKLELGDVNSEDFMENHKVSFTIPVQ